MAQGWEIVERLAGHPDRFIPGHDPIVSEIYPRASDKVDAFALHLPPSRSFVKYSVFERSGRFAQTVNGRMSEYKTIGFIGLGVMGEPICRNLVKKSGKRVFAFDLAAEPLARLRAEGAEIAGSVADVIRQSDLLFLCLPSAKHVRAVFEGDGILKNIRERPGRGRSRHVVGQPDPRFRQAVAGQGRVMGRCADRAHAAGGAGWHAQRHGRRDACALCRDRAFDPLLCHRCHPLRRGRCRDR